MNKQCDNGNYFNTKICLHCQSGCPPQLFLNQYLKTRWCLLLAVCFLLLRNNDNHPGEYKEKSHSIALSLECCEIIHGVIQILVLFAEMRKQRFAIIFFV
jgi:hypothetical protein